MDKNEKLTLSYYTLSDMLNEAQQDGLLADGCCYSLDYDIDEEIKRNIESGDIKMVEDYNNGGYISRQAAIAAIHELKMSVSGYDNDALDVSLIYEVLGEIPAADVQPVKYGWIPTSERFPERFALVLFSVNFGLVEEGFYMGAKWKGLASNAIYRNDDITAWQPLPEPYHTESEDKQ